MFEQFSWPCFNFDWSIYAHCWHRLCIDMTHPQQLNLLLNWNVCLVKRVFDLCSTITTVYFKVLLRCADVFKMFLYLKTPAKCFNAVCTYVALKCKRIQFSYILHMLPVDYFTFQHRLVYASFPKVWRFAYCLWILTASGPYSLKTKLTNC